MTDPSLDSSSPAEERAKDSGPVKYTQTGESVTFAAFILSLWSSVMEQVDPTAEDVPEQDLGLVRNVIALMTMLSDKTAGNLDQEESALLRDLLYELRMKYLLKSR